MDMAIDSPDTKRGSLSEIPKKSGFNLFPVNVNDKGVGLPYAPADWPEPGDQWAWKVGKRVTASGYLQDRYLYPPKRFCEDGSRKRHGMASKQAVKEFIRSKFPNADADAFLASFSWRIPSNEMAVFDMTVNDGNQDREIEPPVDQPRCKAGNISCISLVEPGFSSDASGVMFCDACCGEPGFCRDCSCILCCKAVSSEYGGYGYIRCETLVDGSICGHVAHIKCGLRAYLAGKVGGSIGLDAEYYCRRCDSKTDLVSHAEKLLQICESLTSRDSIDMVLTVGVCMLRGSERSSAKWLWHRFSSALFMLRNGGNHKDVVKEGGNRTEVIPGPSHTGKAASQLAMVDDPPVPSSKFDHKAETMKLEGKIDQILHILSKCQEQNSQKDLIHSFYQQLDHERHELLKHTSSSTDTQAVIEAILGRVKQIKKEVMKLKDMKER